MSEDRYVSYERGLFRFHCADHKLNIEPPLARHGESPESLPTFFGIMLIHCMTLIFIDKKSAALHAEITCQTPFNQKISVTQEELRQQEISRHFKYPNPHDFLQSADLELEVENGVARYTIGNLTLVDDFGHNLLSIVGEGDDGLHDLRILYSNMLAASKSLSNQKFASFFSYDDNMSSEESTYFNVSAEQRSSITSFIAKYGDSIKLRPTAQLGVLSAMVVKKSCEGTDEDGNSSEDGEKYIAHIEGVLESSEVFKNKIDGTNNKVANEILKKQIMVLQSEFDSLNKTINKYRELKCGMSLWCCLFLWIYLQVKISYANELLTLKGYKLQCLQGLADALPKKEVNAAINEMINGDSKGRLFERYGWKFFSLPGSRNTEHNGARTAKLVCELRAMGKAAEAEKTILQSSAPAA